MLKVTLIFLLICFYADQLFAEELDSSGDGIFSPETEERIDRTTESIAQNVNAFARYVDTFFNDEKSDEEYTGSRLRLRLGQTIDSDGEYDFSPRLQINLAIPQTENRLNLFISSFDSRDESEVEETARRERDDSVGVGLRYFFTDSEHHQVSLSTGLRFDPKPDPNVNLRYTTGINSGDWNFNPAQFFFWSESEGFGERTRFDIEWSPEETMLIRNRTQLTYSEQSVKDASGAQYDNFIGLYRTFSERSAARIQYGFLGDARPSTVITEHVFSLLFREAFYRTILFYELEPAVRFLREDDFDPLYEITFRIEINFSEEALLKSKS